MKNKLLDLNNHLFAQLERLSEEDITDEELDREVKRTDAIVNVAEQVVEVAHVALGAAKLVADSGGNFTGMLPMVEGKENVDADHPALAAPTKGKKA